MTTAPETTPPTPTLTTRQAAVAAGLTHSYVAKLIRAGELDATRNAMGAFEITPAALERFLSREKPPRGPKPQPCPTCGKPLGRKAKPTPEGEPRP